MRKRRFDSLVRGGRVGFVAVSPGATAGGGALAAGADSPAPLGVSREASSFCAFA